MLLTRQQKGHQSCKDHPLQQLLNVLFWWPDLTWSSYKRLGQLNRNWKCYWFYLYVTVYLMLTECFYVLLACQSKRLIINFSYSLLAASVYLFLLHITKQNAGGCWVHSEHVFWGVLCVCPSYIRNVNMICSVLLSVLKSHILLWFWWGCSYVMYKRDISIFSTSETSWSVLQVNTHTDWLTEMDFQDVGRDIISWKSLRLCRF